MKSLFKRMIGAATFDKQTYEDVEADPASTGGAVFTAMAACFAAALATRSHDVATIAGATVGLMLTWVIWVALTYVIGVHVMPEPSTRADIGEVVRTTGFSAAPGILRLLALIPVISLPVSIIVTIWMLFTFVTAIRQALDYTSYNRAIAVCLLGWLIHGLLFFGFVFVAL